MNDKVRSMERWCSTASHKPLRVRDQRASLVVTQVEPQWLTIEFRVEDVDNSGEIGDK